MPLRLLHLLHAILYAAFWSAVFFSAHVPTLLHFSHRLSSSVSIHVQFSDTCPLLDLLIVLATIQDILTMYYYHRYNLKLTTSSLEVYGNFTSLS